jgi:MoaA/NifB/PqqE/SkfB family radical SAM enzyme
VYDRCVTLERDDGSPRALRVLVALPPLSVARDWIDYPYFADLGAVQLAAVLRAPGLDEIRLLDAFALPGATLHFRRDGRAHLGAPLGAWLEHAEPLARDADAIVVAVTPFHRPALAPGPASRDDLLSAALRGLRAMRPEVPILLADAYQSGQHYVETDALLATYPEADAWVKYEAEVTVPRLLDALRTGARPSGVHRGQSPASLDALPLPAWDLVDLVGHDRFRARVVAASGRGPWQFPIDGRTLPLVTTRGCPFRCAHCSSNPGLAPGEKKIQRRLSPARLRALLEAYALQHGATRLAALDELINVSASHFDAFLDAVEALDLRFEVPNGFRADYLGEAQIRRLAGRITTLSVSAESGSPRVLDEIVGKELDLADVTRVAAAAHAARVPSLVHFIVGLPGETAAEINETLSVALELFDRFGAEPAVQFATPLPGTRLAREPDGRPRALPLVDDWGPRFQTLPSQPGALVSAEELLVFRDTFEARLRASRAPDKVIVNVTYACNNHCTFCAVGTRSQVDGDLARQRAFLEQYRALGVRMVDLDGGEPTLHPDLVPLIQHARRIGYERVTVTTNGRLLAYESFAERLLRSGLTTLLFSVHGADARSHARQVGVAEAFAQTTEGIRNAARLAPPGVELGMNVTITKSNHEELPALADLAWSLGLRWMNLQFLTPFGRATRWIAPDTQAAADVAMRVIDAWQGRMRFQVINLPFCFMPGHEALLSGDLGKRGRHMVFVNNDAVNLADYLAERRVKKEVCRSCPRASFCGGFYELDAAPEPPWLVRPEDLVRPAKALVPAHLLVAAASLPPELADLPELADATAPEPTSPRAEE